MTVVVNEETAILPPVRPLGHQILIEILDEYEPSTERFGIVLPDQERSQQGVVLTVGDLVDTSPEGVHPGDRVLFDDHDCPYWRGANPMSYLSVVLGEGAEYVLAPEQQILAVILEADDGGDQGDGETTAGGEPGDGA